MLKKAVALSAVIACGALSASAGSVEFDPLQGSAVVERTDLAMGEGDASYALSRTHTADGWAWSCDSRLLSAAGNERLWVDEAGRVHAFAVVGQGWVARYGSPWQLTRGSNGYTLDANGNSYSFDSNGQLLSRSTRGATIRFTPGPHGPTAVEGPWGRLNLERHAFGVTRAVLADAEVRYAYTDGKLAGAKRDALSETYAYDTAGRLTQVADTTIRYDEAGRVTSLQGGRVPLTASYTDGQAWTCDVVEQGAATRYVRRERDLEVTEHGSVRHVRFDARLRTRSVERDGDLVGSWTYDAAGRLTQRHDLNGDLELTYGSTDRPTRALLPSGEELRFVYDEVGHLTATTSPLGTERFAYDAQGQLIKHVAANGRRTHVKRDARGYTIGYATQGQVTRVKRSSAGDVLAVKHPDGRVVSFNERGAAYKAVDAQGTVRAAAVDTQGRMIAYQDEFGRATRLAYNGFGQVARSYDKDGERFRCDYDAQGRLIALTDATGNTVTYSRPDATTLIVDDPSAGRRELSFDSWGRLVREQRGEHTLSFRYDTAGRLIGRTTPRGEEHFAYDRAGRLVSQTGPDGELRYTYDAAGRLTSSENRLLFERISYRYEGASSQPCEVGYPWGSVHYTYDAAGNLTEVTSGERTVRIKYDDQGRRVRVHYPSGVETRTTYAGTELSEIATYRGKSLLTRRAYTYDARGRVATVTDEAGVETRFAHDRRGRLVAAANAERSVRYTYDAAGTRSTVTLDGQTLEAEVGAGNRVTRLAKTAFTYGANGALATRRGPQGAWSYTHDVDGRLRSAIGPNGASVRYGYAPDGTPLWREADGQRERFLVDRKQVVGEFNDAGLTRSYVRGAALDDVLLSQAGDQSWELHSDRVSSVTALTDDAGKVVARYSYGAFGESLSAKGPAAKANRVRYAGRPLDPVSGLYDMRARSYDSELGRFTAPDPSGRASGLNLYAYAENDPTRFSDPLGLWGAMRDHWTNRDPNEEIRPFGAGVAQAFREGMVRTEALANYMGYGMEFNLGKGGVQAGRDAVVGVGELFKKETWVNLYEFASELDDWDTVKAVGAHIRDSSAETGARYWEALKSDPNEAARMTGYGGATVLSSIFGTKGLTNVARGSQAARVADAVEDVADAAEDVADAADDVADAAGNGGRPATVGMANLLETMEDVKPHGDFRRGLQEGLAEPVSDAARQALATRWSAIQDRATDMARGGWRSSPEMQDMRMNNSGTLRGEHGRSPDTDPELPARNFQAADDMVRMWARADQPLTLDRIKQINEMLGDNLTHNNGTPGAFRGPNDHAYAGTPARLYSEGKTVPEDMDAFIKWYNDAEAAGMPPVELAARTSQRLVSIHPFADANGRTSQLVMDYVLQRNGLPPATMTDKNLAVFGGERAWGMDLGSVTPEQAITRVTDGVERSLSLLEAVR